jgi:hypothetical protein
MFRNTLRGQGDATEIAFIPEASGLQDSCSPGGALPRDHMGKVVRLYGDQLYGILARAWNCTIDTCVLHRV